MMPSLKTASVLAPVLGPLAARLVDRILFDQPSAPSQVISLPPPSECSCCNGSKDVRIDVRTCERTAEMCSNCATRSRTAEEEDKHLLKISGNTSEDSQQNLKEKMFPLSRSVSDSRISSGKKAKIDDKTLALLAHHFSKEIRDESRSTGLLSFPRDPNESRDFSNKSQSHRAIARSSKSSKSSQKTENSSRICRSSTIADFQYRQTSRAPVEDLKTSCRQVAHIS